MSSHGEGMVTSRLERFADFSRCEARFISDLDGFGHGMFYVMESHIIWQACTLVAVEKIRTCYNVSIGMQSPSCQATLISSTTIELLQVF
ncbi:uncharacterized protein RSE6_10572 [Rhynchosporium secalis]|uniref:Uncharacterized protein n=1 Tax=Rhynchosporium secalis TaxID=38038 RepID=A0A1E1MKS1_RHYSE|nr:uncharacterized protein RSE6_10572 [Rhynchosporium secalis]